MADYVNFNEISLLVKCNDIISKKQAVLNRKNFNDDAIVFCELSNTSIVKFKNSLQEYNDYLSYIRNIVTNEETDQINEFLKEKKFTKVNNSFLSCEKLFDLADKYYKDNIKVEEEKEKPKLKEEK